MSLCVDGKGFQYKQNPRDQARAPKAREWRKKSEGLSYGCTARGAEREMYKFKGYSWYFV